MIGTILGGILVLALGVIGVKYGIAAIIAGFTAIGIGLGIKKD